MAGIFRPSLLLQPCSSVATKSLADRLRRAALLPAAKADTAVCSTKGLCSLLRFFRSRRPEAAASRRCRRLRRRPQQPQLARAERANPFCRAPRESLCRLQQSCKWQLLCTRPLQLCCASSAPPRGRRLSPLPLPVHDRSSCSVARADRADPFSRAPQLCAHVYCMYYVHDKHTQNTQGFVTHQHGRPHVNCES